LLGLWLLLTTGLVSAVDTTNTFNNVVTNITDYTVQGASSGDRLFHIWNNSQLTVANNESVGLARFGSLTLNNSTNFASFGFMVGQNSGITGIVNAVSGSLIEFQNVATNAPLILGFSGIGRMSLTNSTLRAWGLSLGEDIGSKGELFAKASIIEVRDDPGAMAGDVILAGETPSTGTIVLTDGSLFDLSTNQVLLVGYLGTGKVVASNSTIRCAFQSIGEDFLGVGDMILVASTNIVLAAGGSNGRLNVGSMFSGGNVGTLVASAGSLIMGQGSAAMDIGGFDGTGTVILSNSTMKGFSTLFLGRSTTGSGTLRLVGATNVVNGDMRIGAVDTASGVVSLKAGSLLVVTNASGSGLLRIGVASGTTGSLTVENSAILADAIQLGQQGSLGLSGTNSVTGIFTNSNSNAQLTNGTTTVNGNVILAANSKLTISGAELQVTGDRLELLSSSSISVPASGIVRLSQRLLNSTTSNRFNFAGTLSFNGDGISAQQFQVRGINRGCTLANYTNNFGVGTLQIGPNGASVFLNATPSNAQYAARLIVESGSTFDLNSTPMFTSNIVNNGTLLVGGTTLCALNVFTNNGLVQATGSNPTFGTTISGATVNNGTTLVENATITFSGSVQNNGVIIATNNGHVAFPGGITGAGVVLTNPPPVASFSASPTFGQAPLIVTFTDSSTGTISNRFWNFGNGQTTNVTAKTVNHSYNSNGTNTVTLIVRGPTGVSTSIIPNYIEVSPAPPPVLAVEPASRNFGSVALGQTNSLTFTVLNTGVATLLGSASVGAPFTIQSGSPFSISGGQSVLLTVRFAPATTGAFNSSVVFTSNGGASTNAVSGTGISPAMFAVSPSNFNFGVVETGVTAQTTFVVTNKGQATLSGTASVSSVAFNIASGSPFTVPGFGSTNVVVEFTPPAAGAFATNLLFASNGGGSTNPLTGTGAIVPVASFNAAPTDGLAPLTVTFADTSTGTITNRFWDFGDGTTTNTAGTNVVHEYTAAGTNTVTLIAQGPLGASTNSQTDRIVVTNLPPILVVTPGGLDFGTIVLGETNTLPFQVINAGELSLTGTATVSSPFEIASGGSFVLAGGETGTVQVSFVPFTSGAFADAVAFSSNGGNSTNVVLGAAITPGEIGVSPVALDFGTVATGTTAQAAFVVTNSGAAQIDGTATVSSVEFALVSGSPFSLAGFESTNIVVSFTPTAEGGVSNAVVFESTGGNRTNAVFGNGAIVPVANFSAVPTNGLVPLAVTFTDSSTGTITNRFWSFGDGGTTNTTATNVLHEYVAAGSNTVALVAQGPLGASTNTMLNLIVVTNIPPLLATSPASRNFGSLTIGQTTSQTYQVVNTGGLPLSGSASVGSPFAVVAGSPFNVNAGATTTVTVAFTPVAATTVTNNVVFTSNGGNATNLAIGTGLSLPMLGVTPASLGFGTIATGATAQASFVVTNKGASTLTGNATAAGGPFTVTSGTPFTLAGFDSTNVVVSFTPTSAATYSNSVFFSSNGGNATNAVIGTGAIAPTASFTGSPTNGLVPLAVAFTDTSTGTITNRIWTFGDGAGTNLNSLSVQHVYTVAGTNTVRLIVQGPLGVSTNTRVDYIVATNLPPILVVSPSSRNFGSITIGNTSTQSFDVINSGGETLTGTASVTAPFGVLSGSPFNVPPFSSASVAVTFTPVTNGTFNRTVVFTSNGGVSSNAVTGIGLTPPQLGVSPTNLSFGTVATGVTAQASFVVSNLGGTTMTGTATVNGTVFTLASGSPFTVPGFGSTNVVINFRPPTANAFTTNVFFASNGGNRTNAVSGTGAIVPVASFSGTPTNGVVPLTVTFTDSSTGTITNRFWNFGDGATTNTTATNVVHQYPAAGTNTVMLIVRGPVGASTNTRTGYIIVTNVPPILQVSPSSQNLGSVTVGQTNSATFSVINAGGLPLSGTASVGSPFAVSAGSPYNVNPGETGTVSVSFIPTAAGLVTSNVVFVSNGGNSTNAVSGTGLTPAQLSVAPASLSFGTIATGTTAQASFTVTNLGGSTLSGTATSSGGPFAVAGGSPFTVAGFGSTNVLVSFQPTSEGGFTNSILFASNGGNSTNAVAGSGAIIPNASFTGTPTNGLAPLAVTFTDVSTGTITNRFWNFGDGATTNTTSTNVLHSYLSAGTNTVTLIVRGPVGASTNIRSAYIIATNIPPILQVSPASRDFGSVTIGQTNTLPFQVFNAGQLTLTGTATVASPFLIASGGSYSVAPGQTGTVNVSFIPATAVTVSNAVAFTSNGGTSSNLVLGTGITPGAIGISPVSIEFGTIATGTTAQADFVLTNSGASSLSGSATALGGPFTVLSGTPFNIAGFGSTNVVIRFSPVSEGGFTNAVAFTSTGGDSTNTVRGNGAIPITAQFTGSPTNGLAPLAVTFTDTSTGTITNRNWTFGDGGTTNTTATTVPHTYNAAGTNTVRLIAQGPLGASTNTRAAYILVTNIPPMLTVTPASRDYGLVAVGQTNTLPFSVINGGQATLTGTVAVSAPFAVSGSSAFSVAGGQTGTVNVSFLPVAAGAFTNNVVFTSNNGSSTNMVTGQGTFLPAALFTASPSNGVAPLTVTFTDTSTGTITNRAWSFGDGVTTNTTATNLVHTYTMAGTNTITLIAQGPGGASTNTKPGAVIVIVYPPGDVTGDRHVTGADSLLINQVLVHLRSTNDPLFVAGFANGDVNQNGATTGGDSLLINQTLVGLRAHVVTKILPGNRSTNAPTAVTIYGIGFPTNAVTGATIGSPVNLTLSNVVAVSREEIRAILPAGGGLGTGTVNVVATPTNGVISFGRFINQ
jgi:PKD repeat protein